MTCFIILTALLSCDALWYCFYWTPPWFLELTQATCCKIYGRYSWPFKAMPPYLGCRYRCRGSHFVALFTLIVSCMGVVMATYNTKCLGIPEQVRIPHHYRHSANMGGSPGKLQHNLCDGTLMILNTDNWGLPHSAKYIQHNLKKLPPLGPHLGHKLSWLM